MRSNSRGKLILEWMAVNDLVIMNSGKETAFHRGEGTT